jgi:hypothetical protein
LRALSFHPPPCAQVPYIIFIVLIWSFGISDLTTGSSGAATAMLLLMYG